VGTARSLRTRYTLKALADLAQILDYISARSPQGAEKVKARIQDMINLSRRGIRMLACGRAVRAIAAL
jgi:plasmid stabilization system protein ParE